MRFLTAALALLLIHAVATMASADLIVENGPATSTSHRIGGPEMQTEGVIWGQVPASNVSITALIGSVDGQSETVYAYLVNADTGALLDQTTVTVGSFASPADFTPVSVFSGLSLSGGDYGFGFFNADTSGNVNIRWSVGATTTNTANGGFETSAYSDGANTNVSYPYLSNFTYDPTTTLGFTVASVPEPSTIVLGLTSVAIIGAVRLRRRRDV